MKSENFKTLSILECQNLIASRDITCLDVRTKEEIEAEGEFKNSINLDFFDFDNFRKDIKKLNKEKEYLVFCTIGGRSKAAAQLIADLNIRVFHMDGGLKSWNLINDKESSLSLSSQELIDKRKDILKRLSRIEGQVRGVKKMVENEDYCPSILNQTLAISSALKSVNKEMLEVFFNVCLEKEGSIDDFFNYVRKVMK